MASRAERNSFFPSMPARMGSTFAAEPLGTEPGANGAPPTLSDGAAANENEPLAISRGFDTAPTESPEPDQSKGDAHAGSGVLVAGTRGSKVEGEAERPGGGDVPSNGDIRPAVAACAQPIPGTPAADRLKPRQQCVDPSVSRTKYDREVAAYRRHEDSYRSRGWLLLEATFPSVFLVLCVPHVKPACVVFGLIIDFTNYDAEPVSVRVVDPFTKRLLTTQELVTGLLRKPQPPAADLVNHVTPDPAPQAGADLVGAAVVEASPSSPGAAPELQVSAVALLQSWGFGDVPFLCVPGVLEYHTHPGHSGDSWLRHRIRGVGTLDAILNVFHTYGVLPVAGYAINLSMQQNPDGTAQIVGAQIGGLTLKEIPA